MSHLYPQEVEQARRLLNTLHDSAQPRRAASSAEAMGAALLNAQWRRVGMSVDTRPADIVPRPGFRFWLPLLLTVAAGLLQLIPAVPALLLPWLSLGFDLSALLLIAADGLLPNGLRLVRRAPTQTIVAVRHIEGSDRDEPPAAEPPGPRRRVILAVALDAAPLPGLRNLLQGSTRRALLLRLILLAPASIASILLFQSLELPQWLSPATHLGVGLLLALLTLLPPRLPAHDSNRAAQAAVTAALEQLTGLSRVELWAVGFGGGNIDDQGVGQFLARFPFQRSDTLVLVVGPLSGPHPSVVRRAGALETQADFGLYALAERVDRRDAQIGAVPRRRAAALPLVRSWLQRGYRVLQIDAQQRRPGRRDDEAQLVARSTRLLVGVVRMIEEDADALRIPRQR